MRDSDKQLTVTDVQVKRVKELTYAEIFDTRICTIDDMIRPISDNRSNIDIFIDKLKEQHPDWTADSYVEVVRFKEEK